MDSEREVGWNETEESYHRQIGVAQVIPCLVWLRGGRLDESLTGLVAHADVGLE